MSDYIVPIVIALITTGLPGIVALVVQIVQSRKVKADATDVITEAAKKAVELVRSQLDNLQTEYKDLNDRLDELQTKHGSLQRSHDKLAVEFERVLSGAHQLKDQVIELNAIPVYNPPERRTKFDMRD